MGDVCSFHGHTDGVARTVNCVTDQQQYSEPLDTPPGHGLFGIEISKTNPKAKIVTLAWVNVLTVAKDNAAAAGASDRYQSILGRSFYADLDRNYGLMLLTNFLHYFDTPAREGLLQRNPSALMDEDVL